MDTTLPVPEVGDTIIVRFFGLKKMGRVLEKNNDIYTVQYKHATVTDTLHFPWYYPRSSPKHVKLDNKLCLASERCSGRKRTPTNFYKAEPARCVKKRFHDIPYPVTAESDNDDEDTTIDDEVMSVSDELLNNLTMDVGSDKDMESDADDALRRIREVATSVIENLS